jgi:hypothetical protein
VTEYGLSSSHDEHPSRLAGRFILVPLERRAVPQALSRANREYRSGAFCYIQARYDLEAVLAYLNRYREQPKTLRAYTKELQRSLLWAAVLCCKSMSSLLVDDCEAYNDFLANPDPRFAGQRFARSSPRWRPFASGELSAESQHYAIRVLRARSRGWSTCAIWPVIRGRPLMIRRLSSAPAR